MAPRVSLMATGIETEKVSGQTQRASTKKLGDLKPIALEDTILIDLLPKRASASALFERIVRRRSNERSIDGSDAGATKNIESNTAVRLR